MADASDDLGIPMKPARPAGTGSERPGKAHDDPAARPRSGARRRCDSRPGAAPPPRRAGCSAAAQRHRGPQADGRPRDHPFGRDHLLRQADHRGQRRGQPQQLPRCRDRRERAVQGLGLDRGSRDPGPLRRQSGGPQAAVDQGQRAGLGDDSLRPDRDRVRRADLGRRPGAAGHPSRPSSWRTWRACASRADPGFRPPRRWFDRRLRRALLPARAAISSAGPVLAP